MSSTWWRAAGYLWGRTGGWSAPQSYSTASSNTRLWVCPSGPQLHIRRATCRQVTHKHKTLPRGGRGFPDPTPPHTQYPNDPSDVNRGQMRKSQRGGAAGGCTQHCKHTSVSRESLEICVRVSQRSALLIDWYFHYGCRVVRRMLICLGVLQVYDDCSRARRKAELMKLTEPNHNLWVKINWLIII